MNNIMTIGLFLGLICKAHAGFVEISPASYTFDQTTGTDYADYEDTGGVKLTDGKYGNADWQATADEWVGWLSVPTVNIDFDFGSVTKINKIVIGTVQDSITNIVLPSVEIFTSYNGIDWVSFAVRNKPESSANDNQYFTYEFNGLSITDQYIRVRLYQSLDGPWIFTDEIDFYQDTSAVVPAPAAV